MSFGLQKHWNKSHIGHPVDRLPSNYARDKEKYFPRSSVVCDLGGGDGVDSLYFIQKGHKVYLYDISDIGLEKAKARAAKENVENKLVVQQIDLSEDKIPVSDNFFDIVYSRLSIHYFYKDRLIEILKDIYRVLKQGGVSFIVVKSPEDLNEMKWLNENTEKLQEGVYSEGGLIKTRFAKDEYRQMLESAGITNFEVNDYLEKFGEQKIFVKSKANELLYIEIVIRK